MTRDDIINMAREAGFNPVSYMGANFEPFKRFAALVAAAEREACAKVVETIERNGAWVTKAEAAAAIRARGEQ